MTQALRHLAKRWLPPAVADQFRQPVVNPPSPFTLPVVTLDAILPDAARQTVLFPMSQWSRTRDMVLPLPDYLVLGALAQALQPMRIFEIGTYKGSTTLLMALNSEAEIFTLDLPQAELPQDQTWARFQIGSEYQGTAAAVRIRQLAGRSESFDFSPYYGTIDLAYIDAVHSYEAVKRDSQTALALVRPGGLIVWDDYVWEPANEECAGVTQAVNEFATSRTVHRIDGTRLAIHRTPAGD